MTDTYTWNVLVLIAMNLRGLQSQVSKTFLSSKMYLLQQGRDGTYTHTRQTEVSSGEFISTLVQSVTI